MHSVSTRALALVAVLLPAAGIAQQPALPFDVCGAVAPGTGTVLGPGRELLRLAEITGAAQSRGVAVRRASDGRFEPLCPGAIRPQAAPRLRIGPATLAVIPPRTGTWFNSGYPDDRGNGLVWAGRGASAVVSTGALVRLGPLTAALVPEFAFQQNGDYDRRLVTREARSEFGYPFTGGIDYPQRFGDSAYGQADWRGQSFVRLDLFGFAVGAAHENFRIGPARRNPYLMGATSPGYDHVFLGTSTPLDVWIGEIDGELVLGRVEESDYFDSDPANDRNRLAIWAISFEPRWLSGLELGAARAYMYPSEHSGLSGWADEVEQFLRLGFPDNLTGNELASLFGRWVFAESEAEVYGEWGRDDGYGTVEGDLLPEPDHSQIYTLGFQKVVRLDARAFRVEGELSHFQERQEDRHGRPLPDPYTHSQVRQGYTHRGQLLGAGMGIGADAQMLGLDLLEPWGYAGVFLERVRRNDAFGPAVAAREEYPFEHDVEFGGGVRALVLWRGLAVTGSLGYSRRYQRDFLRDDHNVKLRLEASGWPGTNR